MVAKLLRKSWLYRPPGETRLTHSRMLGDFFLVVTPWRLTSSGSLAWATDTRFCTSTWAMFRSVPSAKVTLRYTCTVGGATSGYWATGSWDRATTPTMTRMIDSTAAKIGRSMKKWEIMGEG